LGFSAALGFVVGAIGDAISVDVVLDGGSVSSVGCRGGGKGRIWLTSLPQLCTPRKADIATAPQKKNSVLRMSSARGRGVPDITPVNALVMRKMRDSIENTATNIS
jgi:hypothetical protein